MEDTERKLFSADLSDRLSAIGTLRDTPSEQAVPLLIQAVRDSNARVRYAAVSLLGQKGDASHLELLKNLLKSDPEFDVRAAAAAALGDLHDPAAYEALAEALDSDSEWLVRFSIVAALGELGDPRAFEPLSRALDAESLIRTVAAGALGQLGDRRAVPLLKRYLEDEDWQLRFRLAQAFGDLGGPEAQAALEKLANDSSEQVATTARAALSQDS